MLCCSHGTDNYTLFTCRHVRRCSCEQLYPHFVVQTSKPIVLAAVKSAAEVGYRHFDTASIYDTEAAMGEALNDLISSKLISRDDVFVTTKVLLIVLYVGKAIELTNTECYTGRYCHL